MGKLFIDGKHMAMLTDIFRTLCPESTIWAFGSRIDGTAHVGSDLDLAMIRGGQNDADAHQLKMAIQESNIPFLVDMFELNQLPESFQREIKRHYVVVYDVPQSCDKSALKRRAQ